MGRGTVRALVVASIVMGVLIVAGVASLVTLVARRAIQGRSAASASPGIGSDAARSALLDEPAGTRIVGAAGGAEALVLRLEGGGPDRVVVLDPRSGRVLGRVGLAR